METDKNLLEEMEKTLNQLGGVISSKIIKNDRGEIVEIHVLADKSRNPKQISRDVQSALMAKFNVDIDYKVISVAEIENDGLPNDDERLRIRSLQYSLEGIRGSARVVLEKNDIAYEGEYSGVHSSGFLPTAFINAVVSALNKYISDEIVLVVEDYKFIDIANLKVLVVVLSVMNTRHKELYIGNAIVHEEIEEACVKAVLNAVNRVVNTLKK
ncbi:hypothetical protein [Calorimonas adulescens]|uniref:Uncharacterized protein n=1 Tax=Calorimonas adulescens TaxID=2606906 RepID=A0A5D8QD65_9THEO|nr:hypothetical protein [Calorimonas adulescens]TZE82590.1 hypothetical protein FWJ32_04760 [Calorimonas adulescens]